jgi:general stress protein 26
LAKSIRCWIGDWPMSRMKDEPGDSEVSRLLAGVAKMIGSVRYCWLVTESEAGGVNARPMGRVLPDADENDWNIRFVADGRSHKASDIRRASKIELIFQRDRDDAFAAFTGRAALLDDPSDIGRLWKSAYDSYFPNEVDRANAVFIETFVERMKLWIRGVTPEPFGLQPTIVERGAGGGWYLVAPRS